MKQLSLAALVILTLAAAAGLALAQDAVPVISILSPDPGITVATDAVDVIVAYQAPKGASIKRVDLVIDGTVVQSIPVDPPERAGAVSLVWDAASYQDGEHQVVVRAVDTKEKTAKSVLSVSLRRQLPDEELQPRITSPPSGATVAGTISVEVALAAAQAKYVIFLVDNVFKAMSNIRPFAYNWDTTRYLNGLHRLQAKAYLADGAEALSRIVEVRVDNPSGMTAVHPSAPPASKPEGLPARTPGPSLPAAIHAESPTPYTKTVEVTEAEFGPPGSAPYISASGDLVQSPATPIPVHTEIALPPELGAFPAPPAQDSTAPQPASASVVAPPRPAAEPMPAPAAVPVAAPATPGAAPVALVVPPATSLAPTAGEVATTPEPVGEPAVVVAKVTAAVPAAPSVVSTGATAPAVAPVVVIPLPRPSPALAPRMSMLAQADVPQPMEEIEAAPPVPSVPPAQIAMLPPERADTRPVEPKLVAQPTGMAITYTVQTGDSLWTIAARHCVTVQRLAAANGLQESQAVRPGQRLRIPSTMIYVNGKPLASDAPPAVAGGRTMAPFRAVIEQTGGSVSWEPNARQARARAQGREIAVTVGSDVATVDDEAMPMGAAAAISGGRTFVPLRFLGEALDMALQYRDGVVHVAGRK